MWANATEDLDNFRPRYEVLGRIAFSPSAKFRLVEANLPKLARLIAEVERTHDLYWTDEYGFDGYRTLSGGEIVDAKAVFTIKPTRNVLRHP
jgi:hypothetical protein